MPLSSHEVASIGTVMLATTNSSLAAIWVDRDLSWLDFNGRVLAEALDQRTPLLERVKFLAIFASNLDEFFMKRMAVLREHRGPESQRLRDEIRNRLRPMLDQQAECFLGRIVPELARHGIHLRRWEELSATQQREASMYFDTQVSPALTPLVIHPAQPFPFFSNGSLSVAFALHDERQCESVDARIKVPPELPQWIQLSADATGERVFVRLHEVIRENAHKLYPGMRLTAPTLFRLTRDAEVELDEDTDQGLRELYASRFASVATSRPCGWSFPRPPTRASERCSASVSGSRRRRSTTFRANWTTRACFRSRASTCRPCATFRGRRCPPMASATMRMCSRRSRRATSSCTTRTRASTTASNASSARPPTIRTPCRSR